MKMKHYLARLLWKIHTRLKPIAERAHRRYLTPPPTAPAPPRIHAKLTERQRETLDTAIRLSFCGDLILLRDMVENARTADGTYDFTEMFARVSPYWKEADAAIGVFEGPLAGEEAGYSNSCLGDGIPLYLNFPDSYADAVKAAGITLVTTAHNHVLDKGEEAVSRTLDVLDAAGLEHFGSYRNPQERETVKIVTIKGKRIAFLGFTYGSNRYPDPYFFTEEHRHITRKLVKPDSPLLAECQAAVAADFARAKAQHPDLIIAMPHMGREFFHQPDAFQRFWTDFMVAQGADIIMGDHPHCVQPVEWRKRGEDNVLICYCPGNLVSSAIAKDGDASMLAEAYLDPQTGKPVAAAVIPLYAYSGAYAKLGANYQVMPVYDALTRPELANTFSRYEERRIEEVQRLVTQAALGVEIGPDQAQKRYICFADGIYRRGPVAPLAPEHTVGHPFADAFAQAQGMTFINDAISAGTENGGYAWHEPLAAAYPQAQITAYTPEKALEQIRRCELPAADITVIAAGSQDIRMGKATADICRDLTELAQKLKENAPDTRLIITAPWSTHPCDPAAPTTAEERAVAHRAVTQELAQWCAKHNAVFCDPNPHIERERSARFYGYYMLRQHCPNAGRGIRLFSEAFLHSLHTP